VCDLQVNTESKMHAHKALMVSVSLCLVVSFLSDCEVTE
jgi:hypothetical protein